MHTVYFGTRMCMNFRGIKQYDLSQQLSQAFGMSKRAKQGLCTSGDKLVHFLAKGSVITYDVAAADPVELGAINIPGLTGLKVGLIEVHPYALIVYAAVVPKEERAAGDIIAVNLVNQRVLRILQGHERQVTHLLWVPRRGLLSASLDGTARLWYPDGGSKLIYATGRKKKAFLGETDDEKVSALVYVDGRLFIGNEGGGIDIFNFETQQPVVTMLPLWKDRRLLDLPQDALADAHAEHDNAMARIEKKKQKRERGEDTDSDNDSETTRMQKKAEREVWGKGNPKDKRQLARRAGAHDNGIVAMVAWEESIAATTTAGEVVVSHSRSTWHSLRIFERCYGGCIEAANAGGRRLLFAGNAGYDAADYEVVVMSVDPMEQLRRVKFSGNSKISLLHWSVTAQKLVVGQEDKGLFVLSLLEENAEPVPLFLSTEDRDSMDDESILDIAEQCGQLCVRTSFGRIRRYPVKPDVYSADELPALQPAGQFGIVGRSNICFNRYTGTVLSARAGYDEYKLDSVVPGGSTWRRHDSFPLTDGSGDMLIVEDGAPDDGVGYPGKYKVRPKDTEAGVRTVKRDEIGGLMLLKKGWPPSYIQYLEIPGDHMVVVAGELGGLIKWEETSDGTAFRATSFEGGKLVTGCCSSIGVHGVSAAADDEGGLVIAAANSATWVYHWTSLRFHGEMLLKDDARHNVVPSQMTPVPVAFGQRRALVAAWMAGACSILDLRALACVKRFAFGESVGSKCMLGGAAEVYAFYVAKNAAGKDVGEKGTLAVWGLDDIPIDALQISSKVDTAPAELQFSSDLELVSSLVLLKDVGLLTAHSKVMDGISIWDPARGTLLYKIFVSNVGRALVIRRGPGDCSIMWSSDGGRVGFLGWNSLTLMGQTYVEDGVPQFGFLTVLLFLREVATLIISVLQVYMFALAVEYEIPLPNLMESPPLSWLAELKFLQGGLIDIALSVQFISAAIVCVAFASIFYVQESVERRAFLAPQSWWPKVKNLSLPLVAVLTSGWYCTDKDELVEEEQSCWSRLHLAYIGASIAALLLLALCCARLIRVNFELVNIDARGNPLDISGDLVPTQSPESLIAASSTTYGLAVVGSKYVLQLILLTSNAVAGTFMNCAVGATLCVMSLITDPFIVRQQSSWLQMNSLQFAMDVFTFWTFLCAFMGALVSEEWLPSGNWLDWMPVPLLVLFPLMLMLRPMLQCLLLHGRLWPWKGGRKVRTARKSRASARQVASHAPSTGAGASEAVTDRGALTTDGLPAQKEKAVLAAEASVMPPTNMEGDEPDDEEDEALLDNIGASLAETDETLKMIAELEAMLAPKTEKGSAQIDEAQPALDDPSASDTGTIQSKPRPTVMGKRHSKHANG